MMSEPRCRAEIGRIKMTLPIYKDEETTLAIAREVDARITQIEADSGVIDTQKNAAIAAFQFAVEKQANTEENEEDIRELAKALERVTSQLKALNKRFHLDALPNRED